jgi:hypothetical protein
VTQGFLEEHRLVPAGDRAFGERGAPATCDRNGTFVSLGQLNRYFVVVLAAGALSADDNLHRLLPYIEQLALFPNREAQSGYAVTEIAVEPGAQLRAVVPVSIKSIQRLDTDTVGRRAHHFHLRRTAGLDHRRCDGELDRLGTRGEVHRRGGDATTLEAQRHVDRGDESQRKPVLALIHGYRR